MATLCLTDIKEIPIKRQMSVFGYIHKLESKYNHEIPEQIIKICILFYGDDRDRWDPKCMGKDVKMTDRTIMTQSTLLRSSFGKRVVASGIYAWKLRVDCLGTTSRYRWPTIGIWKVESETELPPTDRWYTRITNKGYAFDVMRARLTTKHGNLSSANTYGKGCKTGTVIEMILDMNNLSLKYIIDGVDYGKAFDVEVCKYRLCVFLSAGDSFTIL